MKYDPSKQSLTMETAECKVTLSFSVTPKEASIWHYVCIALTQQPTALVQTEEVILEQRHQTERSIAMNRVYCLYRVSDRGQVEKNDIPMQRIACQTFA